MKAITDTLDVARSNQYEARNGRTKHYGKQEDTAYLTRIRHLTGEMVRDLMALAIENRFGCDTPPHVI
jgi:hypothetical protein